MDVLVPRCAIIFFIVPGIAEPGFDPRTLGFQGNDANIRTFKGF